MNTDRVAGALSGLFFLVLFLLTGEVQGEVSRGVGPRFFPYAVSIMGMALSLVLLISGLRASTSPNGNVSGDAKKSTLHQAFPALIVVAASVLYSLLWQVAGFIVTSTTFVVVVLLTLGERKIATISAYTAGVVVVIYLIFRVWLEVPLPRGLLI